MLSITDETKPWLPAHVNRAGRNASRSVHSRPSVNWNGI